MSDISDDLLGDYDLDELGAPKPSQEHATVKSDVEIVQNTLALVDPEHGISMKDLDIALVRAGREAVLKQVVEREGMCLIQRDHGAVCAEWILVTNPEWHLCTFCWATAQLDGSEDEG